jgi:predicted DNA-binding transcriptional regulator AlpA
MTKRWQTAASESEPASPTQLDASAYVPGPKLRASLGISAVTLWRWRHDKGLGFPQPLKINDRLYFPRAQVLEWLEARRKLA